VLRSSVTSFPVTKAYNCGVPTDLKRFYGASYLHFITSSCYQRRALLHSSDRRDLFLRTLEQVRLRYQFAVVGYVVMPEHFHLLISEPEKGDPSVVMQVLKQPFARQVLQARSPATKSGSDAMLEEGHVWQRRFYDFVVWSEAKRVEKLRYMHRNPVQRGLVLEPDQWAWSSFRHYAYGEPGPVLVNEARRAELKIRDPLAEGRRGDQKTG
jgi:putative transposase